MKSFWQSKKWLAFGVCVIIGILTLVLNSQFGLNLDPNIILSLLGLNAIYIIAQGNIDAKNPEDHFGKQFFDSHKFIALLIGDVVPLLIGWVNKNYGVQIPVEAILGLIGLDSIYIIRKAMLDIKEPEKH